MNSNLETTAGQPVRVNIFIAAARGRLAELRAEIAAEGARLIERGVTGDDDTLWRDLDRLTTERDDLGRALADALSGRMKEADSARQGASPVGPGGARKAAWMAAAGR